MQEPGRQKQLNTVDDGGYRWGFNSKEKDDEWHGSTGTVYDYGFRIYDARIAKFLSVDPLTKSYPMLTPYQFASLNPIYMVDIDGLEGESYIEYMKVDGEEVKVRRVIEVNVHLAVTEDRKNPNGFYAKKGFKKLDKVKEKMAKTLNSEFNGKGFMDEENDIPVEFRFNIETFNVDEQTAEQYKENELNNESVLISADGERMGTKSVILKPKEPDEETNEQGNYYQGIATIYNNAFDKGHTTAHEIGHFMLYQHPDPDFSGMSSEEQHNAAGGIFHYVTPVRQEYKDDLGNKKSLIIYEGKEDLNQSNVNEFMKSTIYTGTREVTE
jgi:RHS repeat-associated protein